MAGYVDAVQLELLPLQTAGARMHGFVMLFLLVAPMALAVFAIFSFTQRPVHGSSGFTCGHQLGVGFAWTRLMAGILLG